MIDSGGEDPYKMIHEMNLSRVPVIIGPYVSELIYGKYGERSRRNAGHLSTRMNAISMQVYDILLEDPYRMYNAEHAVFTGSYNHYFKDYGYVAIYFQLKPLNLMNEYGLFINCAEVMQAASEGRSVNIFNISPVVEHPLDNGYFDFNVYENGDYVTDVTGKVLYEQNKPIYNN